MSKVVEPCVRVIGYTRFEAPEDVPWSTDAEGGQALAEFAGRACYQSWNKPNPATATNAGYCDISSVGHLSVLEHGTVTFTSPGLMSFTHELVRHRLLLLAALPAVRSGARRGHGGTGRDRRGSETARAVHEGGECRCRLIHRIVGRA
jgi:hypothetical protein